jgi:hypothetical protein
MTSEERAYDYYVTVEQPGSWNRGWQNGYEGEPFDDQDEPSEQAYSEGFKQGQREREVTP